MSKRAPGQRMREAWDARARANAMHYIDSRRSSWEADEFFESGRSEARAVLAPALSRLDFDPAGKRILEIGCGLGRLFLGYAELFAEVWGIDVSPEMVARGMKECPVEGARFIEGDGESLAGIGDGTIDYCFSYLVFHHLPDNLVVRRYLREIARVLAAGGCCQIQLLAGRSWRDRIVRRAPQLHRLHRVLSRDRLPCDVDTWVGTTVVPDEARAWAQEAGLVNPITYPHGTPGGTAYWLLARKPV